MSGYRNFEELVPPIGDTDFLKYFDDEVESGSYRDHHNYSGPDEVESEFPERVASDEAPF
ncbi:MAG: hypothetical protein AABY16_04570 [Nanoarchaeota archaeon]